MFWKLKKETTRGHNQNRCIMSTFKCNLGVLSVYKTCTDSRITVANNLVWMYINLITSQMSQIEFAVLLEEKWEMLWLHNFDFLKMHSENRQSSLGLCDSGIKWKWNNIKRETAIAKNHNARETRFHSKNCKSSKQKTLQTAIFG